MIPFDFIYLRPDTLEEAAAAYESLHRAQRQPFYYGGGSEIITMSRSSAIRPGAVIDLKSIPECRVLEKSGSWINIGALCTLTQIHVSKIFPLLGLTCGRIADHSNQCRITLGGNLCGTIIYRETCLPLLLSDAEVTLFGPDGTRRDAFSAVFDGQMQLKPGELVVKVHIPAWAATAPYAHIKKTDNEKIDYPLLSVSVLSRGGSLRVAFSGLCSRPFRSEGIETVLNDKGLSRSQRAKKAAGLLPEPPGDSVEGSGEYRIFVLEETLKTLLEAWENGKL